MRPWGYFLYTAGQLGVMMLTRYFFQWVIRFSDGGGQIDGKTVALFSASAVGLVFMAFRIFDAVIDPVAGAVGDAWVRRGRQRRQLLWFALPWPSIGLALVFSPSLEMAPGLRWVILVGGMFAFFAGYSLYSIPFWSLIEDYSRGDQAVRTRLSNAQGVGLLLATAIGFIASPIAVDRLGFQGGAIVFAIASCVLMALPYFAAPREEEKSALSATSGEARGEKEPELAPWAALRVAFRDRRFRGVIVLFTGVQMSFTIMTASAPYIAEHLLGGTIQDVAWLLGPFLLSALVFFSFVPRWSARFGWERVVLGGAVLLAVAYLGAGFLGRGVIGSPWQTAMLVFACAGPGAAVILGLEGEAIARCASESEEGGTGSYFGLYNMVVQALNGVALSITGVLAEAARSSLWAVRGMPILAGFLCFLGVILYWEMFRRSRLAAG